MKATQGLLFNQPILECRVSFLFERLLAGKHGLSLAHWEQVADLVSTRAPKVKVSARSIVEVELRIFSQTRVLEWSCILLSVLIGDYMTTSVSAFYKPSVKRVDPRAFYWTTIIAVFTVNYATLWLFSVHGPVLPSALPLLLGLIVTLMTLKPVKAHHSSRLRRATMTAMPWIRAVAVSTLRSLIFFSVFDLGLDAWQSVVAFLLLNLKLSLNDFVNPLSQRADLFVKNFEEILEPLSLAEIRAYRN